MIRSRKGYYSFVTFPIAHPAKNAIRATAFIMITIFIISLLP